MRSYKKKRHVRDGSVQHFKIGGARKSKKRSFSKKKGGSLRNLLGSPGGRGMVHIVPQNSGRCGGPHGMMYQPRFNNPTDIPEFTMRGVRPSLEPVRPSLSQLTHDDLQKLVNNMMKKDLHHESHTQNNESTASNRSRSNGKGKKSKKAKKSKKSPKRKKSSSKRKQNRRG